MEPVKALIRQDDGNQMPRLHPEKPCTFQHTGTTAFGNDFPDPVQHDIGSKDQPFRKFLCKSDSKITASAAEIQFHAFPFREIHQVG